MTRQRKLWASGVANYGKANIYRGPSGRQEPVSKVYVDFFLCHLISSDKAIIPFLVWEVGVGLTPSQGEFTFCFKVDGGGQRVHPGWLFLNCLQLKIILCQSGIFWVDILWTPSGQRGCRVKDPGNIQYGTQANHAAHCHYSLSSDVYTNNISLQGTARQTFRGKEITQGQTTQPISNGGLRWSLTWFALKIAEDGKINSSVYKTMISGHLKYWLAEPPPFLLAISLV